MAGQAGDYRDKGDDTAERHRVRRDDTEEQVLNRFRSEPRNRKADGQAIVGSRAGLGLNRPGFAQFGNGSPLEQEFEYDNFSPTM